MKRILVLALGLALSACNPATFFSDAQLAVTGVANPVTPTMLYDAENGAIVVFAGLNAYKRSCIAGAVDANCRATIQKMQIYTRQIKPYLAQLRTFVKDNDQVNASVAYTTLTNLLATVRQQATASGVTIGGN